MITLDVADLVVIAGQTLGTGTQAALSELDLQAARAALAEAHCRDTVIIDQESAAYAGIRLMHALLRHRPFPMRSDGIAVAAGLQFLSLNGWRAELDPPETAAVVVEALACGQLSPAAAVEWLSPRLTADKSLRPRRGMVHSFESLQLVSAAWQTASLMALKRTTSAPPPKPFQPAAVRAPASVIYPRVLLFIQAGCWAAVAMPCLFFGPAAFLPVGLAVWKVVLGLQVNSLRSRETRLAVIVTELAMTCFGMLWLLAPAQWFPTLWFPALGVSGAFLSLAAVLCLNRPDARQYFGGPDAIPSNPDPGALSGPVSFRRLALIGRDLAVI